MDEQKYIVKGESIDTGEEVIGYLLSCKDGIQVIIPRNAIINGRYDESILHCTNHYFIKSDSIRRFLNLYDADGNMVFEGDTIQIYQEENILYYKIVWNQKIFGYLAISALNGGCTNLGELVNNFKFRVVKD